MASPRPQDRISLCRFTFSDDRKCLTPRAPNHPHFCYFHARKESRSTGTDQIAQDLAYYFSGDYLSANDLSAALARLFPAVVRGDIKPRTARTLAYLSQTLIQTIHAAQFEYQQSQGVPAWREAIRTSIDQNFSHTNNTDSPLPPSPKADPNPISTKTALENNSAIVVPVPQPASQPIPPPESSEENLLGDATAAPSRKLSATNLPLGASSPATPSPVPTAAPIPTTPQVLATPRSIPDAIFR